MKLERKVIGKIKLGSAVILVKTGQTYLFGTEGAEVLEANGDEPGVGGMDRSDTQGVPEEDPRR